VLVLLVGLLFGPPLLGYLSAGPKENAKALNDDSSAVARQINDPHNKPGKGDVPQNAEEKLVAFEFKRLLGDRYQLAALGPSAAGQARAAGHGGDRQEEGGAQAPPQDDGRGPAGPAADAGAPGGDRRELPLQEAARGVSAQAGAGQPGRGRRRALRGGGAGRQG